MASKAERFKHHKISECFWLFFDALNLITYFFLLFYILNLQTMKEEDICVSVCASKKKEK